MLFIPSSPAAAPAPPASPDSRAPARSSEQEPSQPGSFGQAMARSREASQEKAAEPAARPAPYKPVRRPADAEKATPQDSVNLMAALLAVPLESRLAATAMPGGADAADAGSTENPGMPANTGLSGLSGLSGLLATAPAGLASTSGMVLDTDPQAAPAPGLAAISPKGADLAPLQGRETPASHGLPLAADLRTQAAPAPGLAAISPKGADLAPLQGRETPASHGLPLTADSRALNAQADAASAGLSDPSSGQGDDGPNSTAPALDGRAEPSLETADTTLFAGTGTLAPPAGAALQQPGSLAAANAPAPMASALLTLEVGSSEWGKALGQQVIHLSAADAQVAELQLNPPGLGPLKVTLSMSDQQMQAAFVSAHSSVRAAVEAALPQLRALLAESGISLGQTSVGAESQPQTAFANSQGDAGGQPPRASHRSLEAGKAALLFPAQPAAVQSRPGRGLRIDTYA